MHTVTGVMKMENIVARAGIEPTSLTFRASVLPLHHVGKFPDVTTMPMPTMSMQLLASEIQGQCRQLHY